MKKPIALLMAILLLLQTTIGIADVDSDAYVDPATDTPVITEVLTEEEEPANADAPELTAPEEPTEPTEPEQEIVPEAEPVTVPEEPVDEVLPVDEAAPMDASDGEPSEDYCPATEDHNHVPKDIQESTCLERGDWVQKCTKCGYEVLRVPGAADPKGHTFERDGFDANVKTEANGWSEDKNEDCTATRYGRFTCTDCHAAQSKEYEIPGLAEHAGLIDTTVLPTCTTPGSARQYCTVCGKVFLDVPMISATGHRWALVTDEGTKPHCGQTWERRYECQNPGCSMEGEGTYDTSLNTIVGGTNYDTASALKAQGMTSDGTPKAYVVVNDANWNGNGGEHQWGAPVEKKATCTEDACTEETCELCGEIRKTNVQEGTALGHNWGKPTNAPEQCGDQYKHAHVTYCVNPGCEYNTTPITDHFDEKGCVDEEPSPYAAAYFVTDVKNCYLGDKTTWTCGACGWTESSEEDKPRGHHSYESAPGVISEDAVPISEVPRTCTTQGVKHYKCTDCGVLKTVDLPLDPTKHDYQEVTVEPDCVNDGYTLLICSYNSEHNTQSTIPATGHKFKEINVTKPATCTENGERQLICVNENCPGYDAKWGESNGDAIGETTDGKAYKTETIPFTGHNFARVEAMQTLCGAGDKHVHVKYCINEGCDLNYGVVKVEQHPELIERFGDETDVDEEKGHAYFVGDVKDCYNGDYKYWSCSVCGWSTQTEREEARGHHSYESAPGVFDITKYTAMEEANCTHPGYRFYECEDCGTTQRETLPMEPDAHDWVLTASRKADCELEGFEMWTCANNSTHTKYEVYDALGHAWDREDFDPTDPEQVQDVSKKPTCTEDGYTQYLCKLCDYNIKSEQVKIDKLGHVWEREGFDPKTDHVEILHEDPTCTEAGYTQYKCLDCEEQALSEQIVLDALGHDYDMDTVIKTVYPIDCQTPGYKEYACKRCEEGTEGHILHVEFPAAGFLKDDGHKWVLDEEASTPASCLFNGKNVYKCANEGCTETKEEVGNPYTDHKFSDDKKVDGQAATCVDAGYYLQICQNENCDGYKAEYGDLNGAATEEYEGQAAKRVTIPATGEHTFGDWHTTDYPGVLERECTVCGKKETNVVTDCTHDALQKAVEDAVKNGTYEGEEPIPADCANGAIYENQFCEECLQYVDIEVGEGHGHTWKLVNPEDKPASCTEDWTRRYVCVNEDCPGAGTHENFWTEGASSNMAPGSHNYEIDKVIYAVNQTEEGYALYVVSGPWENWNEETGETTVGEHVWDDEYTTIPPYCTTEGYDVKVCLICGTEDLTTKTNVKEALGHDFENGMALEDTAIEADCANAGKEADVKCSRCDEVQTGEEIPALGHLWVFDPELSDPEPPYCEMNNEYEWVRHYTCVRENCSGFTNVFDVVPGTIQEGSVNYEIGGEIIPTGVNVLGHAISEMSGAWVKTNPENGMKSNGHHVWENDEGETNSTTVAAKCTEPAYTVNLCWVCGAEDPESKVIDGVALGHDFENGTPVEGTAVVPTCTTAGKEADVKCSRCEEVQTGEEIPALGHTWARNDFNINDPANRTEENGWKVGIDASCTERGFGYYACLDCQARSEIVIITALGHDWDEVEAIAPGCITPGVSAGRQCKRCETIEGETIVPATGHAWGEPVQKQAAGCETTGINRYTCTNPNCGYSVEEGADNKGATGYDEEAKKAYKDEEIPATGHTYDDKMIVTKPSTCATNGEYHYVCTVCGAESQTYANLPLDPDNHEETVTDEAVAPGCITPGKTEGTHCGGCGKVYVEQGSVNPLGHKWDEGRVLKAPTCTEPGLMIYACQRKDCEGYHEDAEDNYGATGNDLAGRAIKEVELPATGDAHVWGEYVYNDDATCIANGTKTRTCTACKIATETVEDETHPATGHKFATEGTLVTKATCVSAEIYRYECENEKCGYAADGDNKGATGFNAETQRAYKDEAKGEPDTVNGHDYDMENGKVTTEANCVTASVTTYTCKLCGQTMDVTGEKDMTKHANPQPIPAVAPTCTTDGHTAGVKCEACNTEIVPPDVVAKLGHEWEREGVDLSQVQFVVDEPATCTTAGSGHYVCKDCNAESEPKVIEALGHELVDVDAVAAGCITDGSTAGKKCTRCTYTTVETVPATGHTWDEGKELVPATCKAPATWRYTCVNDNCGYVEGGDNKGATGFDAEAQKAYKDEAKGDPDTVNGHDYDMENGKVTTEATCVVKGVTTYTCKLCEATMDVTGEIDENNHKNVVEIEYIAPTCVKDGANAGSQCADCKKILTPAEVIPALGHDYDYENGVRTEGTCQTEETVTYTCKREGCTPETEGHTLVVKGEKNLDNHTSLVDIPEEPATCTKPGKTAGQKCEACDVVTKEQKETPALGHDFQNYVSNENATCTEDGTKTGKCTRCEETDTQPDVGSALGHDFQNYVSNGDATCAKDGTKTGKCTRCEETDTVPDVGSKDKVPHTWGEYVYNEDATCGKNGTMSRTCTVCGVEDPVAVEDPAHPATGAHTWGDWVVDVPATDTTEGSQHRNCTVCGQREDGVIPKTFTPYRVIVRTSIAIIRSAADNTSEKVALVPEGTVLWVLAPLNGVFYVVSYNDQVCYININYCDLYEGD